MLLIKLSHVTIKNIRLNLDQILNDKFVSIEKIDFLLIDF